MSDPTNVPPEIVVPGSISNLGPGFDVLSVAVQLYLRVRIAEVRPSEPDTVTWEFAGAGPTGENRIESAYRLARREIGISVPGLRVQVTSDIPQTAGLGSSAAAAVAGLRLYEAMTSPRPVEDWLRLATRLEGHPDNAAAALLGGMTLSCQAEDGRILARAWQWPDAVTLVVATPEMGLHTSHARQVLPATIPLADAIFNLQRALLLVDALRSTRYEDLRDLREAMKDRWHQPARAALVPGLTQAIAFDDPEILGVCLSGAGPSIVALASDGGTRATVLLTELYKGLGLPCTIRVLLAQPTTDTRPN